MLCVLLVSILIIITTIIIIIIIIIIIFFDGYIYIYIIGTLHISLIKSVQKRYIMVKRLLNKARIFLQPNNKTNNPH